VFDQLLHVPLMLARLLHITRWTEEAHTSQQWRLSFTWSEKVLTVSRDFTIQSSALQKTRLNCSSLCVKSTTIEQRQDFLSRVRVGVNPDHRKPLLCILARTEWGRIIVRHSCEQSSRIRSLWWRFEGPARCWGVDMCNVVFDSCEARQTQ
jgi:hypothetical protein